jgi:8-oxo-dGTP pyrophosphatase MutT (NUDIX family)
VTDLRPEALRGRIRAVLAGRRRRVVGRDGLVAAAVLACFAYRGGRPVLLFGKRTEAVPHHKGQVSFPGGVVQEGDPSPAAAALREAREEVGLDPAAVEVLGLFDDAPTSATNFVITPVVGLCPATPPLRADGREIERVLEIPLAHLLEPASFREEWWERDGVTRPVAFFTYGDDVVWGATGRILRELLDAFFPEAGGAGRGAE